MVDWIRVNRYKPTPDTAKSNPSVRWRAKRVLALGFGLAVLAWVLLVSYAQFQAESWFSAALAQESKLKRNGWRGSESDYEALLIRAENAANWDRNNAKIQYWLNYYRWQAVTQLQVETESDAKESPAILEKIADELAAIRWSSPFFHRPYILEGMIRGFELKDEEAAELLLQRGADLSINDGLSQFTYGLWLAQQGNENPAKRRLRAAADLDEYLYPKAVRTIAFELDDVSAAISLAGDQTARIRTLIALLKQNNKFPSIVNDLREKLVGVYRKRATEGLLSPSETAELARKEAESGNHEPAVKLFRQALSRNYSNTDWRFELALSLKELRKYDEAMREARTCYRSRTGDLRIKQLLNELVLLVLSQEVEKEASPVD